MAKCTAHSRTGKQCGRLAINGATVCHMHGGGAPQVKAAAQARIMALVDPSLGVMYRELKRKTKHPNGVAVQVARDILDRAGFKPKDQIEISGSLADKVLAARKRAKPSNLDKEV